MHRTNEKFLYRILKFFFYLTTGLLLISNLYIGLYIIADRDGNYNKYQVICSNGEKIDTDFLSAGLHLQDKLMADGYSIEEIKNEALSRNEYLRPRNIDEFIDPSGNFVNVNMTERAQFFCSNSDLATTERQKFLEKFSSSKVSGDIPKIKNYSIKFVQIGYAGNIQAASEFMILAFIGINIFALLSNLFFYYVLIGEKWDFKKTIKLRIISLASCIVMFLLAIIAVGFSEQFPRIIRGLANLVFLVSSSISTYSFVRAFGYTHEANPKNPAI